MDTSQAGRKEAQNPEEMTPQREARIRFAVSRRQLDLTVILENVHDPHNIAAVLRSCESIGITEIYVLYTEEHLIRRGLKLGKRTSAGARKWVDVRLYNDRDRCMTHVKERYNRIYATHLGKSSINMYEMDFTEGFALLLGNEAKGISEEAMRYADANIYIPQMGMVRSLNISVSCAVILYEVLRQRIAKGMYAANPTQSPEQHKALLEDFFERHEAGKGDWAIREFGENG